MSVPFAMNVRSGRKLSRVEGQKCSTDATARACVIRE